MSERLSNDLLCQLVDGQKEQAEALARIEGDINARVKSLEKGANRNWWMTYVITPFLFIAKGVATHFGVKI